MAHFGPESFALKNGKSLTVRSLTAADGAAFLDFQRKVATETRFTLQMESRPPDPVQSSEAYAKSEADTHELRVGFFNGGRMVAQIGFHPEHATHPWTRHTARFGMMVLQEYWGQGIGRRLLEIIDVHAKANDFRRIEAMVRTPNERGIRLYQKAGYKIEGTRQSAAFIEGEFVDEYYIAKLSTQLAPKAAWTPPVLTTQRLLLRPLTEADAPALFAYAQNSNVSRWTLWEPHRTEQDTLDYIRDYAQTYYQDGEPEPLGICLQADPNQVVGTVGCFWISRRDRAMELAYALAEPLWGKGIMGEASRALLNYAFLEFDLLRIQARCKVENLPSARVMEKLGMRKEGVLRSALVHRDRAWDMAYYGLLREEWSFG